MDNDLWHPTNRMEQKNFEILTEKIVHDKGKCYIKEVQGVFKVVNLFRFC